MAKNLTKGGVKVFAFDEKELRKPRARKAKVKYFLVQYPPRRCKGTLTIRPSKGFRADRGVVYVGNNDRTEAAMWLR